MLDSLNDVGIILNHRPRLGSVQFAPLDMPGT